MNAKEKIIGLVLIIIISIITYLSLKDESEREKSINENKYSTVCKVYKIDSGRGFTHVCYYYYYKNKKIESWDFIDNDGSDYINRYYRVNISTKKPEFSKIFLDQEITETAAILDAGFRMEEIKQ